jgi:hypothetical protein
MPSCVCELNASIAASEIPELPCASPIRLSPSEVQGLSANWKLVTNGMLEIQSEFPQSIRNGLAIVNGGSDGTRTRGLLGDRQAF